MLRRVAHRGRARERGDLRDGGLAGLREHEARERHLGAVERFLQADAALVIGQHGLRPDAVAHRAHDQHGEDERDAGEHARRQALLQAQGLAQQREHDHDAGEARHEQQHRGQEGERGEEQQGLDRHRVGVAARALADHQRQRGASAGCGGRGLRPGAGGQQGERGEQQAAAQPVSGAHGEPCGIG